MILQSILWGKYEEQRHKLITHSMYVCLKRESTNKSEESSYKRSYSDRKMFFFLFFFNESQWDPMLFVHSFVFNRIKILVTLYNKVHTHTSLKL